MLDFSENRYDTHFFNSHYLLRQLIYRSKSAMDFSCNTRDTGDTSLMNLIPESQRFPGGGNGNLHQYSYLENPTDRGAWQAIVHGVAREWDATEHVPCNIHIKPAKKLWKTL